MLSQREIDKRSGHEGTFWRNVDKRPDGKWLWTGATNNNHNTVDCQSYDYGVYELVSRETSNLAKPTKIHDSKMAHRVVLFLTYGRPVPKQYDVFPVNGDHLDINPDNLWLRHTKDRAEISSAKFFDVANDNENEVRAAA